MGGTRENDNAADFLSSLTFLLLVLQGVHGKIALVNFKFLYTLLKEGPRWMFYVLLKGFCLFF